MSEDKNIEIVFDVETTGLDPKDGDRIIEIGAVVLENKRPTGEQFHKRINPQGRMMPSEVIDIHGITNEELESEPTFSEILDEFLEFFTRGDLVAHNSDFDMKFVNSELERCGKAPLPIGGFQVIDTLEISRAELPQERRHTLDALCKYYDISTARRTFHGALLDSELLAEVYIRLTSDFQTGLALDDDIAIPIPTATATSSVASPRPNASIGTVRFRPAPLPSRLSDADIARHKEFVKNLGEKSHWNY